MGSSILEKLEMPQPINCERCGELSTVHANQYVYKPQIVGGHDIDQILVAIVSVIECPHCGVRTQTVEVPRADRDGHAK